MILLIILIICYLTGSIPTSIIVGKKLRGIDIREHGSGNAGTTNVFRVMGSKLAVMVLIIDVFKGWAAVALLAPLAARSVSFDPVIVMILAGSCAIAGHIWTIFAGFRGGKGVGASLGVFIALLPVPTLIAFLVWLVVVLATRYVSVASLAAGIALPAGTLGKMVYAGENPYLVIFSILVGVLIWVTHKKNIKRLQEGTENRFGKGKKDRDEE